jgi:hypothetical protein
MLSAREKPMIALVNIARSACATGVFANCAFNDQRLRDVIAPRRDRRKTGCTDSESRFLAIKKFSRSPASRLIAARQNRFFARIARS